MQTYHQKNHRSINQRDLHTSRHPNCLNLNLAFQFNRWAKPSRHFHPRSCPNVQRTTWREDWCFKDFSHSRGSEWNYKFDAVQWICEKLVFPPIGTQSWLVPNLCKFTLSPRLWHLTERHPALYLLHSDYRLLFLRGVPRGCWFYIRHLSTA